MGPQGKQFEFVPCGPILQHGTVERGGWALPRLEDKKPHIPHS